MVFEEYLIYGIAILAIGLLMVFWFIVLPWLAERDLIKIGKLGRSKMYSKMKSDNRLYNMFRTGGIWMIVVGVAVMFVLMFFIVTLTEAEIPVIMRNVAIATSVILITFVVLFAVQIHNKGRRFLPVSHNIAIASDGVQTIQKDILVTHIEEIGEFSKGDREAYFAKMSLQFCQPFQKELLKKFKNPAVSKYYGSDEDTLLKKIQEKQFNWKLDSATDWNKFCETNCIQNGGKYCQFYYSRQLALGQANWRVFEATLEQFGAFSKAVYIMQHKPDTEFARFDRQFAMRGVIIGVSGADINCLLVDINHTIDVGIDGSKKPQKVLCPIFWVYASAPLRKQLFQGIIPESLKDEPMETILMNRPVPGAIKTIDHMRDTDDKYRSAMEIKVSDEKQSYERSANLFDNMMKAGRVIRDLKQSRWFWIFVIALIVAFVILGVVFIRSRTPAETLSNVTQAGVAFF